MKFEKNLLSELTLDDLNSVSGGAVGNPNIGGFYDIRSDDPQKNETGLSTLYNYLISAEQMFTVGPFHDAIARIKGAVASKSEADLGASLSNLFISYDAEDLPVLLNYLDSKGFK